MNAAVITTWAYILQRYTDSHTPIHHLPVATRSLLELRAGATPAVTSRGVAPAEGSSELYSCRLVLDVDKDPLFSLCSPAVVELLFSRIVDLGMISAFGLTGQVGIVRRSILLYFNCNYKLM